MKKVLVIGCLNMDYSVTASRFPKPGETLLGESVKISAGGKGATQAYTVGKLGGRAAMIGYVGEDFQGQQLIDNLASVGVDVSGVSAYPGEVTGQAFITIDSSSGQNHIVAVGGANARVDRRAVDDHRAMFEEADIILMQHEIPVDTVYYAKELALELGKTVIIDPGPAFPDLREDFFRGVTYAKPNETELAILTGINTDTMEGIEKGAARMLEMGVEHVIVSLGGRGCYMADRSGSRLIEAIPVKAVDTTAAGDSFIAAFALALSAGRSEDEAIAYAQSVASISVTRKGAQASIPEPEELAAKGFVFS